MSKEIIDLNKYLEYIKNENVRKTIYEIDIVNKQGDSVNRSIKGYIENNTGSLTIGNSEGARRSVSINFLNFNNEFTDYFSNISLGSRFKLYLGYEIEGEEYLFSQGVFVYSDPSLISSLSNKIITISASDKWSLLDGTNSGILNGTYQVNKGTSLGEFVQKTLSLDIVLDYVIPNISEDIYNEQTTYDIIHEAGETLADVILEVAFNLSCYVYYDQEGVFTMRKFEYDSTLPTLYKYEYDDINYLGATKNYDLKNLYNAILVVGDNIQNDIPPIRSYLENNDIGDINSVINGNAIKMYNVTDYTAGIDTQQKGDERARYELKKVSAMQSRISLQSLPLYHLSENTMVEITDKYLASNSERYLINGITFSIGSNGNMSLELVKAREYL